MRLLDVRTKKLHTFYGASIPPYAILSHTWLRDEDEVTFAQIQAPEKCYGMLGYHKIEFLCQQAISDGIDFAWIDTCCIDKTNSSELSEAINSMFNWYFESKVCYVHLMDVDKEASDDFLRSRWWTRSWTLQELVASTNLEFYDKYSVRIGTKAELASFITFLTGVDEETLQNPQTMYVKSIAQRMSWAASRRATRIEDEAYSLLGIFGINMPMQYGEGKNAFLRLQNSILQDTDDQSLFAWGLDTTPVEQIIQSGMHLDACSTGIFADSPSQFINSREVRYFPQYAPDSPITKLNGALQMKMMTLRPRVESGHWRYIVGLLPCGFSNKPDRMIGILLKDWGKSFRYERVGTSLGLFTFPVRPSTALVAHENTIWIDDYKWLSRHNYQSQQSGKHLTVQINTNHLSKGYAFLGVASDICMWDGEHSTLYIPHYNTYNREFPRLGFYSETASHLLCIGINLEKDQDEKQVEIMMGAVTNSDPWNALRGKDPNLRSFYQGSGDDGKNKDPMMPGHDTGYGRYFTVHIETKTVLNHLIFKLDIHGGKDEAPEKGRSHRFERPWGSKK